MLADIWHRLNQLEKELAKLKNENRNLKEKIESLQSLKIDKIEYKIHELKVQTLSGTLNVGLTSSGDAKDVKKVVDQIVKEEKTNIEVDLDMESPS
ncbi:spore germination protein GerPC [Thermoflavimicrobium daqui]|uniref:spore germination protein GerPC n=1 Tax=Thermoflavimicrobium daqui TaxID=2137476 RepID=UPI00143CDDEC|nr:spore germination protein GerPC [Thermoflavimicrobium daqui]